MDTNQPPVEEDKSAGYSCHRITPLFRREPSAEDPVTGETSSSCSHKLPEAKKSRYTSLLSKSIASISTKKFPDGKKETKTEETTEEKQEVEPVVKKTSIGSLFSATGASDLFNVVREACAHQNVKWPVECQVSKQ